MYSEKQNSKSCSGNLQEDIPGKQCLVSTGKTVHFRRCFMTGEYCSKQRNISAKRRKLHRRPIRKGVQKNNKSVVINAFVIMDYSEMSDTVYEWRIKPFVENLTPYLHYDLDNHKLICTSEKNKKEIDTTEEEKTRLKKEGINPVEKIICHRADASATSNFVTCNRVCQQLQIADLVIVDVSYENANVFYELGFAIALDKLILPICYSESFYKADPRHAKAINRGDHRQYHLGHHPWRKQLYEYFGIIYKHEKSVMRYLDFDIATDPKNKFSDLQYDRFPYGPKIKPKKNAAKETDENNNSSSEEQKTEKTIGELIYNCLRNGYNAEKGETQDKINEETIRRNNTAVVYSLDKDLNAEDAGLCMVNYYLNIVKPLHQKEACFAGNRVGVLAQSQNRISVEIKDSYSKSYHSYDSGELIVIGVNQATKESYEKEIKEIPFSDDNTILFESPERKENYHNRDLRLEKKLKSFWENRGVVFYPKNPVYVDRLTNVQSDIYETLLAYSTKSIDNDNTVKGPRLGFLCLYHIMLKNIKSVNELVVDITDNCIQNIFWLGIAHGLNIDAITVVYDKKKEDIKSEFIDSNIKQFRNVFDVAGLWTAEFAKHDAKGFYQQLSQAQYSIEQQLKLIPEDFEDVDHYEEMGNLMESYYRRQLWNSLLRYNTLSIYLEDLIKKENEEPAARAPGWDVRSASIISCYLSKRTAIGEYSIEILPNKNNRKFPTRNCVCIGSKIKLKQKSLAQFIYEKTNNSVYELKDKDESIKFVMGENNALDAIPETAIRIYKDLHKQKKDIESEFKTSRVAGEAKPKGQILFWRDTASKSVKDESRFYISLNGATGPATYGLTSLLVDSDRPEEIYAFDETINADTPIAAFALSNLQYRIREKTVEIIIEILKTTNEWDIQDAKNTLLCEATIKYLKAALVQFFLPFHSEKDVHSICNSLEYFLLSILDEFYTFNSTDEKNIYIVVIKNIIDKIKRYLMSFSGVEAFYEITVNTPDVVQGKNKFDNRQFLGVELIPDTITCFCDK